MHRKTALLYIITKLELGGAQKQLLTSISRLDKARYGVFLFTAKKGMLIEEAFSINGLTLKRSRFLERPINPIKDFLALLELYLFIRRHSIDIVHTHSSKAGILGRLAARLAGVKTIAHTVHGWPFNDCQPAILRSVYIGLERLAASFTRALIVVSCFDKEKGLNCRIGSKEKYHLIRYAIDYKQFRKIPSPPPKAGERVRLNLLRFAQDKFLPPSGGEEILEESLGNNLLVTMTGCFKPQKSPLDFVKLAFTSGKAFPGVKFVLVGDGVLRKQLETAVSRFNLRGRFTFAGWRKDIPLILSQTDVFVLTSLWEGLPISALEAMASGVPIIATDTGGVREIIEDGRTGFIVKRRDVNAMSERLEILLKDRDLRFRMGEAARKSILTQDFTVEKMVRGIQEVYDKVTRNQ